MYCKYAFVVLVALHCCLAAPTGSSDISTHTKETLINKEIPFTESELSMAIEEMETRMRRQSEQNNSINTESTSRKPTRRRQSLFSLLGQLLSETGRDAVGAFNNISRLISTNLIMPTRPEDIRNNATTSSSEGDGDGDGDGNAEGRTTTPEPYRITQEEFYRILRRNLRGLVNLFNQESQKAIEQDSNNNARQVRKQLQRVLRPFVQPP